MAFFFWHRRFGREGKRAMEEIERETCKGKERERERVICIKKFWVRNKYRMY